MQTGLKSVDALVPVGSPRFTLNVSIG
jgi:F0F1-type ATP synthase alpha subunit